jgi:hemoglobin
MLSNIFHKSLPVLTLTVLLSACSGTQHQENLYTALGGEAGVAQIADNFIMEIANDERVIAYFEDSNVERFRQFFIEHLCMLTDGPCEYTGDSLIDTHVGMNVTEAAFNAIVEDLMAAMNKADIAISSQNRLLARMAALREQIIQL